MQPATNQKPVEDKLQKNTLMVKSGLKVGFSPDEMRDWQISGGRKYGGNP